MRVPGRFSRRCHGTVVMQAEIPLQGLTLVVTRPPAQAGRTAITLRAAGAQVIEFPVLDIAPIEMKLAATELASSSGIIFVSANAVEYGLPLVLRAGGPTAAAEIFAIGRATAAALAVAGFEHVVSPQQSIDSEGLLAMPQLRSVEGRHIILVKGRSELGGRTVLEHTLAARGARVTLLECYRRAPLVPDLAAREAFRASLAYGRVHGCFALSAETLDSLINIFTIMELSPQSQLVLLVPNSRVADVARARGFARIAEVPLAEAALIATLADLKPRLLNPLTF